MDHEQPILVLGSTGKQGGAVARHLLKSGMRVRAFTRDTNRPEAQKLAGEGAELVQGDLNEEDSVRRAMQGVYGVYSVQNFAETGVDGEIHQGLLVNRMARETGVRHVVYSSVGSAPKMTRIPHFDSKAEVEHHLRAAGVPYTILRPVFFMENWLGMLDGIQNGTFMQPLSPGTKLQQIASDDIGHLAMLAFSNPDDWTGRGMDIAGDELSMQDTAAVFSRVLGRDVQYQQVPWEAFEQQAGEEMTIMYRWFESTGYEADIEACRRAHPGLQTLEAFLRQHVAAQ